MGLVMGCSWICKLTFDLVWLIRGWYADRFDREVDTGD